MKRPTQISSIDRPKGETLVWLCSAGLALGILMVVGLLGLIIWQGITVFWPREVIQLTLKEDSAYKLGDSRTMAGVVVKRQMNIRRHVEEWQLFTGNKDAYGSMFKYLDAGDVEDISRPNDIVIAERMEYGNSIFYPVALENPAGLRIEASDNAFWPAFRKSMQEVDHRRQLIHDLEKKDIGRINRQVNSLTISKRTLEKQLAEGEAGVSDKLDKINAALASLQSEFQLLADQARDLRDLQESQTLEYRLASGQIRRQAIGDFVAVHRPNQMGLLDKVFFFFHHLWSFLVERPREANTEGGIFPAIFGTFVMTVLMSACVMPFGVVAAIYLREYARQGPFVQTVRIAVNNLAGVPSIVYGVFGLGFFVYFIGSNIDQIFFSDRLPTATFGTGGILWASLTLAIMTVPVVVVATEEALAAVPRGAREASLACGASKWQTIQRIVLPASAPGILTGLILAMARGAGEVAPLMIVGVVKLAPSLPIDGVFPFFHLERKFMHLGFHIYDLGFQSPDSEAARPMVFATTFFLILLVVILNLGAILIRNYLRKKYATGIF
ncbi:MAG TPA: phosphate ABC transporter permease PstA [Oceanipulchritudo sp.]|nr:phosphate ABC transporter permease PstA [Oceanipulchritudo sp.]